MERPTCKKCGNPLVEVLDEKLYKCSVCGLYHRVRDSVPTPQPESLQTPEPSQALTGDLKIFAERIVKALCPPEQGYSPFIVKEVKSIYDVLEERKDFAEWFLKVRQMLSIKNYQLAKTLYDCLEGLRSQDAKDLREQWYGYLANEMKGYGLA